MKGEGATTEEGETEGAKKERRALARDRPQGSGIDGEAWMIAKASSVREMGTIRYFE